MLEKAPNTALEQAHNQRLEKARFISSQGIALLTLAKINQYQDREVVLQACHYLMDAIQIKRDFIEPYLHLARTFIVFNDDQQAVKYLLQAKDYQPDHPDILALLHFLQNTSKSKSQRAPKKTALDSAFEQSLEIQDPEVLEQQLFDDIRALIASEHAQITLSLSPKIQIKLKRAYQSLQQQYEQIQTRLNLLAKDTEVLNLELALQPLEILLRRFQTNIALSEQLTHIQQKISTLNQQIQAFIKELKVDLAQAQSQESELDKLLDACDALADEIDELASKNVDISLLEEGYQDLVETIVQWQDLLDFE